MRRRARVDSNQNEIVSALRRVGATVHDTSKLGEGYPDLTIGWRGQNFLLEVKDGSKAPSRKKLTSCENLWHLQWKGQVTVVENVDQALRAIGAIK